MNIRRVVRIFLASPGGLDDERRAVREVVEEINQSNSDHWGFYLHLVGWEDINPTFERPQDRINNELYQCIYFIGILWNWWGSRASTYSNQYTSGFHEEFLRASQHIKIGRMEDMAIFFKKIDVDQESKQNESISIIKEFRQNLIKEKRVFFKDFDSEPAFRSLIRKKLYEIGWREVYKLKNNSLFIPDIDKIQPDEAEALRFTVEALGLIDEKGLNSKDTSETSLCHSKERAVGGRGKVSRFDAMTDWAIFEGADPAEYWVATTYKESKNTKDGQLTAITRGEILLLVFFRPSAPNTIHVAYSSGVDLAPDSVAYADVNGYRILLETNKNWAWPKSKNSDSNLILQMEIGADITFTGWLSNGVQVEDTFSLLGFNESLGYLKHRYG